MENHILEVKNITKSFKGGMPALDDVTFTLRGGERTALIGPSGAGKSTLFNIIAKILPPDKGEVFIDRKNIVNIKNPKEFAKLVGNIRQGFDLVGPISVMNNVLVGKFNEWSTIKAIVNLIIPLGRKEAERALEKAGLKGKLYEKAQFLSGGEKQRCAAARLFLQNPAVILADEPVSSLDPERAKELLATLSEETLKKGKVLFCSLHNISLLGDYFDRVIALRNGKIILDRKTEDIDEEDFKVIYSLSEEEKNHV